MANRNLNAKINVTFSEASSRQSLDSGDQVPTLFGKVKKWLSDLKAVAFSGSYADLSGKPTALKNPYALTLNNVTYDGSTAKNFGGFSNPNILDNWDFRNPVNQRGITSWAWSYGLDRWKTAGGVCLVADGYIAMHGYFTQTLENPSSYSGVYTLSFKVKSPFSDSGNIYLYSNDGYLGIYNFGSLSAGEIVSLTIDVSAGHSELSYNICANSEIHIESVKMEKGSVSTLANDPPANPAVELAKCQRYFYAETNIYGASLACTSAGGMNGAINFPVTMRIHPTIVIVKMRDTMTDEILTPTSCDIIATKSAIAALFNFSGIQSLTVGHYYEICFTASADL